MFLYIVSVHKRKKISKNFNEQNILAKILNLDDGNTYRGAMCLTNRRKGGGEVCYTMGRWDDPKTRASYGRDDSMTL
jgi:hypothetical protein